MRILMLSSSFCLIIGDNTFTEFKGAFTEQYVMHKLLVLGIKPYYWSNA